MLAVQLVYHVSPTQSTPSSAFPEACSPLSPCNHGDFRATAKCKFLYDQVWPHTGRYVKRWRERCLSQREHSPGGVARVGLL